MALESDHRQHHHPVIGLALGIADEVMGILIERAHVYAGGGVHADVHYKGLATAVAPVPRRTVAEEPVLRVIIHIDAVVVDAIELDEFILDNGRRLRAAGWAGDPDFRSPYERPDVIDGDYERSPVEVLSLYETQG